MQTPLMFKTTVTTAGTPVVLTNISTNAPVMVIANPANLGYIYVYPSTGAKTDVVPLVADASMVLPTEKASDYLVDSSVSGESVFVVGAS